MILMYDSYVFGVVLRQGITLKPHVVIICVAEG